MSEGIHMTFSSLTAISPSSSSGKKKTTTIDKKAISAILHQKTAITVPLRTVDGSVVNVGFNSRGNKHLLHDINKYNVLTKRDLLIIDRILAKSVHVRTSPKSHPRNDGIKEFMYFKVNHKGKDRYLNVGVYKDAQSNIIKAILYSITKSIRTT